MLDIRSVVFFSISCKRDFFYQLCLIFDQLSLFRSVVLDIRSVVFFSISFKRDFFYQLCLIFRSVVSVTLSISCARSVVSVIFLSVVLDIFDQL